MDQMRSEWLATDIALLVDVVPKMEYKWRDIRKKYFPGRTDDSIRNKYHRITGYKVCKKREEKCAAKRESWTVQEDEFIRSYLTSNPKKWANLALHMPNRTPRAIRGRWDRLQMIPETIDWNEEFEQFEMQEKNNVQTFRRE
tara:strand:+ start:437 stop:862 length:426 start_codon:yes stop_codon:yes gene_type:complete